MDFIYINKKNEINIVAVKGRLDAVAVPDFEIKMADLLNQGEKKFILDLSELEFISSAGLRCILVIVKSLRGQDGKLSLAAMKPTVYGVLKLSGFVEILPFNDTVAEALAEMQPADQ